MGHRLQRTEHTLLHFGRGHVAADPGQVELDRGEAAADVVVDLAGDCRALHLHAGLQVLRQFRQALAAGGQLAVGLGAGTAVAVGLDGVLHRRRQTRQVVLQ